MKPTIAYDGACKFCARSIELLDKIGGKNRFLYVTLDSFFSEHEHLNREECPDGLAFYKGEGIYWGADAVYCALNEIPFWRAPAQLYRVPGIHQLAKSSYTLIAKNRYIFGSCEGSCKN